MEAQVSEPQSFQDQPHKRSKGKYGEEEAVRWLLAQGYKIVERNVVNKCGEIDVVAREGETLCFVEIKSRSTDAFGPAIAAVDARKQRRISRAAALYIAFKRLHNAPCRFDVLGLDWEGGGWRYTLIRNAFPYAG